MRWGELPCCEECIYQREHKVKGYRWGECMKPMCKKFPDNCLAPFEKENDCEEKKK